MKISKKMMIGAVAGILFMCVAISAVGMVFGGIAMHRGNVRVDRFMVSEEGFGSRFEAPNAPSAPEVPSRPDVVESIEGFRSGMDHNVHIYHSRGYGRHGGGLFGLLGGVVRLAGIALLIIAGVIYFRNRGNHHDQAPPQESTEANDDDDDAPDLNEADIRAAMKKLGIDKIEL